MNSIFIHILGMSITAGYCTIVVLLIRFLLLRRQPKIFSYLLWSIVWFRLLCPVSVVSPYSFLPMNPEAVLQEGMRTQNLAVWQESEENNLYDAALHDGQEMAEQGNAEDIQQQEAAKGAAETRNSGRWIWRLLTDGTGAVIWLTGMIFFIVYGLGTAIRFRVSLQKAVPVSKQLYELEGLPTPFVCGIARPRIYLPAGLTEEECRYVLEHERIHIARKDYLVKMLAWAARCIHWFNPLAWLAFSLMENDMELSCDEAVLRSLGEDTKQEYSRALLALSCEKKELGRCPLAFGEGKVKHRILNILRYQKKTSAVVLAAAVISFLVILGLSLDPAGSSQKKQSEEMLALATAYANAFVGRDGNVLAGLYVDEEAAFANMIIPERAGGEFSFGYSSPWPDEYNLTVDEDAQKASIRYYACTSDPHVTVWKEEITFAGTEAGYRVTGSSMQYFDDISSYEEFEEAYWGATEYRFADYVERGYVEAINNQTAYDREAGTEPDRNAVYRSPRTAAEWILNLAGGKSSATNDSSGRAIVEYIFSDGSSIDIPMYNANDTQTTGNTAQPDDENVDTGDVWIVDLDTWNAKAL